MYCLDNAYVRASLNQRPRPATQPGYGVENRKPVSKIRIHLGLFFVTARKKVDGFVTTKKEVDWFFCDLEKEGKCFFFAVVPKKQHS